PGWRVLDAACGPGSFLPLIAGQVGPTGSIAAFDLAPDNAAAAERVVAGWHDARPVEVRVASLTALPYEPAALDALWCANSPCYLDDEDLAPALAEFRRVVRPGGLVAVKDADPGLWLFSPGDPTLLWRAWEAAGRVSAPFRGCFRARTMRRRLERLGLTDVWQRATPSEVWAPLRPVQRRYVAQQLMQLGTLAEQGGLPDADL